MYADPGFPSRAISLGDCDAGNLFEIVTRCAPVARRARSQAGLATGSPSSTTNVPRVSRGAPCVLTQATTR
jgi:hypothetical protein